jgi:hypothetical protein
MLNDINLVFHIHQFGDTALHVAVGAWESVEKVNLLLNAGAYVNEKNNVWWYKA